MSPAETLERQYLRYRRTKASKDLAPVFVGLTPELMGIARRAGLDQQGAEDVVQETFLAFIASEERFEAGRPMVPWVRGIAARQILAARRRQARLRAFEPLDERALEDDRGVHHVEAGPLERAEEIEMRRRLESAIEGLSRANREVLTAVLLEGSTIAEASARLNISRSATSVRLHRGLNRVRKQLGKQSSLALLAIAIPKQSEALPASALGGMSISSTAAVGGLVLLGVFGLLWLPGFLERADSTLGRTQGVTLAASPTRTSDAAEPLAPGSGLDAKSSANVHVAVGAEAALAEESLSVPSMQRTVQGQIRMESGRSALAGAEVFALQTSPAIVLPTAPLVPVAVSKEDGTFACEVSAEGTLPALPSDTTPLLMVRFGGEIGWLDITQGALHSGQLPEIQLSPELHVEVLVQDESGQPLEGVSVAALSDVPRFMEPMGPRADEFGYPMVSPYRHLFGAVTDERGKARVAGLFGRGDPGLMVLLTAKKAGYARAMVAYVVEDLGGIEAEVELASLASLRMEGTARGADGEPLADVELRFRVRGEAPISDAVVAKTDASGGWEIPNQLLDEFPLFLAFDRADLGREEIVVLDPAELEAGPFEVRMQRTETLGGIVTSADGEPVPDAEVTLATVRSIESMRTGADGTYRFSVPVGTHRSVTVLAEASTRADGAAARSIRRAAPSDATRLDIELPNHRGVEVRIAARLSGGGPWDSASLIPRDVVGTIGPIPAARLEGALARFERVPFGSWVLCGVTEEGVPVVENVEVGDSPGKEAQEREVIVRGAEVGFLDCVIEMEDPWSTLSGGESACRIVASHVDLPALPESIFRTGAVARTDFYFDGDVDGPFSLSQILPGAWSVFASGPGWATEPAEVVMTAGARIRLDLKSVPSGTLQIELPTVTRACLLRFSIRRTAGEPWSVVAMPPIGAGLVESLALQVPEGSWQWRAELEADGVGDEFSDVSPPLYGLITAKPGTVEALRVLDGALEAAPETPALARPIYDSASPARPNRAVAASDEGLRPSPSARRVGH